MALLGVLCAACGSAREDPIRLRATITRPPKDTARLALPATATRCADRRSLLLEALSAEGNGFVVRLRYGDSLAAGAYPVNAMDDTGSTRNAMAAVRYIIRQVPHVFSLDTGVVDVRVTDATVTAHVQGRGVENAALASATADFTAVPIGAQSTPCQHQP